MTRFEPTARWLRHRLLRWFAVHRRDLPWRRTRDPYAIWISEVMLQQTQVKTVIPYWENFLARFPTLPSLARASLPEVLAAWRGLGYYSRARHLHRAAQLSVAEHDGELPATAAALAELPGFGRYTAGAVASIAFGENTPVVDGNVARVLSRIFCLEGRPGDPARERALWSHAAELVQGEHPGELNQAMMELGATVCRPKEPSCPLCPVRTGCRALKTGRVEVIPPSRRRTPPKSMEVALALWSRRGRVLLGRRRDRGLFGGLWELPSAELVPGNDSAQVATALSRSLGAPVRLGEALGTIHRTLTHRKLTMNLYRVSSRAAPRTGETYQEFQWTPPDAIGRLGMSSAMAAVFKQSLGCLLSWF
jgi:A/G-specific adenine glycosylase